MYSPARILRHTLVVCVFSLLPESVSGADISVSSSGNFQAALDAARPGDTITLQAGAVYTGNFLLRNKGASEAWIEIRSSSLASLPGPGQRVTIADALLMPKIVTPNPDPAIRSLPQAHHYRFVGIEFRPASGIYVYDVIRFGGEETSLADLPHHLELDRVYIHGDSMEGSKRGVALNSTYTTVKNSHISDFKSDFQDTQALCGWNGAGPFSIVNNYLEASGENIMFGGAEALIADLIPSDIEIRGNYLFKPLTWKRDHPSYAGRLWVLKNLLELKSAARVKIDGNILENSWPAAQSGAAVLFTGRTAGIKNPWNRVQDIEFTHNWIRGAFNGVEILGSDSGTSGVITKRITIRDNLFELTSPTGSIIALLMWEWQNVIIDHNTANVCRTILLFDTIPGSGLVYTNNITPFGLYGVVGSGLHDGFPTLNFYAPGTFFSRNIIAGAPLPGSIPIYPADTIFLPSLDQVGFVNLAARNYQLSSSSAYHLAGTDGRDLGADFAVLRALESPTLTGRPSTGGCSSTLLQGSAVAPAAGTSLTVSISKSAPDCGFTAISDSPWASITKTSSSSTNGFVDLSIAPNTTTAGRQAQVAINDQTFVINQAGTVHPSAGLQFVPIRPCRIMDTRGSEGKTGAFGAPNLGDQVSRDIPIPSSTCGIPSNARAYSLNVTVVPRGFLSYLSLYPTGQARPLVSTLNSWNGRTVANAAIVPAGVNGAVTVFTSNATDVVLDINGYFVPPGDPNGLVFYPLSACRIADTRPGSGKNGAYGPPILAAGSTRSYDVINSGCGIPATARAYALNITAQPNGPLGFLTAFPTGQDRPLASTLNSWDGQVVPNAAIIPAGSSGAVSVFVANESHVVVDIAGYFAAPNQGGGNLFYPASPCRIADTRLSGGVVAGQTFRTFPIAASSCGITNLAQSYVLNATAIPNASLAFATLWTSGLSRPAVSHLNSGNGQVVANMVLAPGGSTGSVSAFVSDPSHLVLDISGYFAP
jgi:hypothetical protein